MPIQQPNPANLLPGDPAAPEVGEAGREALLHKTGALQDAIRDSVIFSSVATDEKGIIRIFNVGAERMLGYTALEVVGKMTPAELSDSQENIARAAALSQELGTTIAPGFEALTFKAARGVEDIYELSYVRKDGSHFPAVVSVTALRDGERRIIGYLLIATDNTERRKAQAELALKNQSLLDQTFYSRFLKSSANGPLLTTDPRGIITDVNRQMEVLTGYSRDEMIGAPFNKYFADPGRPDAGIQRALIDGKVTDCELVARVREGREKVVTCTASIFNDANHNLQGVFASARDTTERIRFEHELRENSAELARVRVTAETDGLARADLLSSLSHKLRSPLNTILGFAQLIDSDTPPPTLAQTASVEQILRAGWYLLDLITEILDMAQIDSGKMVLSIAPTSLTEVLRECESAVAPQGRKRGITMTFPEATLPYFVDADRARLKQILLGLLTNAIKFNRKNGTVVVGCSFVAAERSIPEQIRVTVQDTGPGLPAARIAKLFQPFNRLPGSRSSHKGTEIGLGMSKRLVELMGGSMGIESKVGKGSMAWFELNATIDPAVTLTSEQHPAVAQGVVQEGGALLTVLHIEDDPANLKLVERLMSRRPQIRLISATEARLGIQMARANQPDLIIMDINLPGLSGTEALRILRADPATAHIVVVALSANAGPHDIALGLRAGFFRYLTKPFHFDQFLEMLDLALESAHHRAVPGN